MWKFVQYFKSILKTLKLKEHDQDKNNKLKLMIIQLSQMKNTTMK